MVKKQNGKFQKWRTSLREKALARQAKRQESKEQKELEKKTKKEEKYLRRETRRSETQAKRQERRKGALQGFKNLGNKLFDEESGIFKRVGTFYQGTLGKILQYPKDMLEASPIGQIGKLGQGKQTLIYIVGGIVAIMLLVTVMKVMTKTSPVGLLTGK